MGRWQHKPPYDIIEGTWSGWLRLFRSLPPSVIDLSGGEPLLFPGFFNLLKLDKHKYALSTNLQDTAGYHTLLNINPIIFASITCSYHKNGIDPEPFAERVAHLKAKGFNVNINIVDHPTYDLDGSDRYVLSLFEDAGIHYSISPFEDPKLIAKGITTYRCNAGVNTFTITPDGSVYRCLSWYRSKHREEGYMGNAFKGTWEPYDSKQKCTLNCEIYNILNKLHGQPNMFSTYVEELQ